MSSLMDGARRIVDLETYSIRIQDQAARPLACAFGTTRKGNEVTVKTGDPVVPLSRPIR